VVAGEHLAFPARGSLHRDEPGVALGQGCCSRPAGVLHDSKYWFFVYQVGDIGSCVSSLKDARVPYTHC
jgi:hypothetical protein